MCAGIKGHNAHRIFKNSLSDNITQKNCLGDPNYMCIKVYSNVNCPSRFSKSNQVAKARFPEQGGKPL